jgi:uncharacterized membrane protein YdjX (TVP38/TMEM64 family)
MHEWLAAYGSWGPIAYVAATIAGSLVFIPRTPQVVLAGLLFDTSLACFLVTLSSLISAAVSFAITRRLARHWVERLLARHGAFEVIAGLARESDLQFVLVTRLLHVLHYSVVNYGLGLFPISFGSLMWGTLFGLLPGTIAVVYAGHVVGCALVDPGAVVPADIRWRLAMIGVALSALAIFPAWQAYRRHKARTSRP